jgi:hypothetical protein
MSIEYLGEKVFLDEVKASGEIWVARGIYHNTYALQLDREGFSLPVWSSRDKVVDFLKHARLVGPKYEPHAVALEHFTRAWLSDQSMGITEVQLNPDGKSPRVLVLTTEEFKATQGSK